MFDSLESYKTLLSQMVARNVFTERRTDPDVFLDGSLAGEAYEEMEAADVDQNCELLATAGENCGEVVDRMDMAADRLGLLLDTVEKRAGELVEVGKQMMTEKGKQPTIDGYKQVMMTEGRPDC